VLIVKPREEGTMSVEAKKGYGSTLILLVLGVLALHFGGSWLPVLIPVALIVWFGSELSLRGERH
jgi:hypothetical protein